VKGKRGRLVTQRPLYSSAGSHGRVRRKQRSGAAVHEQVAPLTEAQIREIKRRVADLRDPVRYLLVKECSPRFALYYDASGGLYAMNDPKAASLFKSRAAAAAVRKVLGRAVRVLKCTTKRTDGKRVFARRAAQPPHSADRERDSEPACGTGMDRREWNPPVRGASHHQRECDDRWA